MNKKQIGILVGVGIIAFAITIGVIYFMTNKNDSGNKKGTKTEIVVGNYKLKYGKYKGVSEEYDPDSDKMNQETLYIEITDTMLKSGDHNETYTIKGNKIVTSNNIEYEVTANNKLVLLAGGGVEFNYEG